MYKYLQFQDQTLKYLIGSNTFLRKLHLLQSMILNLSDLEQHFEKQIMLRRKQKLLGRKSTTSVPYIASNTI